MGNKRKRKNLGAYHSLDDEAQSTPSFGLGETLRNLNAKPPGGAGTDDGWEVVETKRKKRKPSPDNDACAEAETKAGAKPNDVSKGETTRKNTYPAIYRASNGLLKARVQLKHVQDLVLYVLTDGPAPQWIGVSQRSAIKKVVVLTIPGIELGMLDGSIPLVDADADDTATEDQASAKVGKPVSPDEYYPTSLKELPLHAAVKPLSDMFSEVWPIDAGGDAQYTRLFSPLQTFLNVPKPREKGNSRNKKSNSGWENKPTSIDSFVATLDDLLADDYALHSSQVDAKALQVEEEKKRALTGRTAENGWVETNLDNADGEVLVDVGKEPLASGKQVLAIDCEMCKTTESDYELTRVSVVDWNKELVLDELVKPTNPITDYVTQYSGITHAMLEPITTTLHDIQERLKSIIGDQTILVGHSLVSDLNALKMAHPHVVDTSIIYPHPRGPPFKSALKFLADKYLHKNIQSGRKGHDSIEDARVAMELVRQKCQKGPSWGCNEAETELIFSRLGRAARPGGAEDEKMVSAIVDWGTPARGHGASADIAIGCSNDDQVTDGIIDAVTGNAEANAEIPGRGVDFVWARMRELEAQRGWWTQGRSDENEAARISAGADSIAGPGSKLGKSVAKAVRRLKSIYDALPLCTALVVYTGNNDPRELYRYHALHRQFKTEFNTRKWDEVSVKWTDEEERGRKAAARHARSGIGFVTVK